MSWHSGLERWPDVRPHRLQLTAFGPFAEAVEVDFDRLAEGGLFLMHGETGAGKTTVLDGLSFALYGRVSGERGVGRLRSDHAPSDIRTSVQLELTLGGRRIRITRSPAQQRRKLRGSGVTPEPASVILEEWDDPNGGWRSRSTRVGEVDAELSDLLGMSAEQFHQVVLLPQGQFARFLHSDAGERTALLQRLFSTDRFRRIEDWLAEQRRRTKEAYDDACHAVRRLVARVAQVCGEVEPQELPDESWATERLAVAEQAAAEAAAVAQQARTHLAQAQQTASEAQQLAHRQQRRRLALDRQRALDEGAESVVAAEAEIDAAQRASAVAELIAELSRRCDVVSQARSALEGAELRLPEALQGASSDRWHQAAAAARGALARLADAEEHEYAVELARSEAARTKESIARSERCIAELRALEAAAPAAQRKAEKRVKAARSAAVGLASARAAADRAGEAVSVAQTRDARAVEIADLSAAHLSAREAAAQLREAYNDLRNDRIDSMIAELASQLVDDAPCPVCGALDHPDPSEVRGRAVSRDDEDAAAVAADAARDQVAAFAEQLAAAQSAYDGAELRLGELGCSQPIAALRESRESAIAAAAQVAEQAADLAAAEAELADLEGETATRREELSRLEAELASGRTQLKAASQRQQEHVRRLRSLLGDAPTVRAAREHTAGLLEALEAAETAAAALTQADAEWAAAVRRAEAASRKAGFADVTSAAAAIRGPSALAALQEQLSRAHREEAAVAELLVDPELAVSLDIPAPVTAANAEAERAEDASRTCEQRLATAVHRVEQLTTLAHELEQQLRGLEPLRVSAARAKEVADLAGGSGANRLNMTLSAYVLAARLEEVAEAASHRLRAMTQGRYTLMHSDASRGNGRSGLRLLARDAWTGQDRDTATLSGGETFLASLALALGLAEVVTGSAGGAPLEALFIDEGFGTLDDETLDEVLDVLDGLREGGRLVGVVSHVPTLRHRIPSQLRVRKGITGSSLSQEHEQPQPPAHSGTAKVAAVAPPAVPVLVEPQPEPEPTGVARTEQLALLGAE